MPTDPDPAFEQGYDQDIVQSHEPAAGGRSVDDTLGQDTIEKKYGAKTDGASHAAEQSDESDDRDFRE